MAAVTRVITMTNKTLLSEFKVEYEEVGDPSRQPYVFKKVGLIKRLLKKIDIKEI